MAQTRKAQTFTLDSPADVPAPAAPQKLTADILYDTKGQGQLLDPSGQLMSVPADQVSAALSAGWKAATRQDYGAAQDAQRYDSPLMGAVGGLVRSATFGLSDLAAAKTLAGAEAVKGYKEHNPWASGVGEVAGMLSPVGAGALVGKAGAAAGKAALGLAEREGAGLLARAGAKSAEWTARGVTEGGLMGLSQGISGAALDEKVHTPGEAASRILGSVGTGALLGGATNLGLLGLGTAIKGAAGAGKRAIQRAMDSGGKVGKAEQAETALREDLATLQRDPGIKEQLGKVEEVAAKESTLAEQLTAKRAALKVEEEAAGLAGQAEAGAAKAAAAPGTVAAGEADDAFKAAMAQLKGQAGGRMGEAYGKGLGNMARALEKHDEGYLLQSQAKRGVVSERGEAQLRESAAILDRQAGEGVTKHLDAVDSWLASRGPQPTAAEAAEGVLGRLAAGEREGVEALLASAKPKLQEALARNTEQATKTGTALSRAKGAVREGDLKKAYDKLLARRKELVGTLDRLESGHLDRDALNGLRWFAREGDQAAHLNALERAVKAAKAEAKGAAKATQAGAAEAQAAQEAVNPAVAQLRREVEALSEGWKAAKAESLEASKALDVLYPTRSGTPWTQVEGRLAEAATEVGAARSSAYDAAVESVTGGKMTGMAGLAGVLLGGNLMSGVMAAGGAYAAKRIATAIKPLIVGGAAGRAAEAVGGFASSLGAGARKVATASAGLSHEDVRAVRRELDSLQPEAMEAQMRAQLQGRVPPEKLEASVKAQHAALALLSGQWPKASAKGPLSSPREWKPSAEDMRKASLLLRATSRPESVLEDFTRGRGTREAVKVLEQVHPQMLAEVRRLVSAQLQAEQQRPGAKRLPEARRQQLELLLGVQTNPGLTARIQDLYARNGRTSPGPEPQSPGGKLDVAKSLLTPTQRIMSGS